MNYVRPSFGPVVPATPVFVRPILPYRPRWEGAVEGYAYNATRRFWPTLQRWHQWEDLTQESYIVFLNCGNRYRPREYAAQVVDGRLFMSFFKTSLHNRLVDLVVRAPKYSLLDESDDALQPVGTDVVRELWEVVQSLPRELQVVLMDMCRLRPRFRFSQRMQQNLRDALTV